MNQTGENPSPTNLGDPLLRPYQPRDLDDLLAVWESATRIAHPFLSEEFLTQERSNIPNLYLPNAETWVWEADGRVGGFVALLGNEIGALFVDPKLHRTGIGRALVDHSRGLHNELEVEVFEANALGRAFYDSYGFQQIEEKIHKETGAKLLRMKLSE